MDVFLLGLTPQAKNLSPLRGLMDGVLSHYVGLRLRLRIYRRFRLRPLGFAVTGRGLMDGVLSHYVGLRLRLNICRRFAA